MFFTNYVIYDLYIITQGERTSCSLVGTQLVFMNINIRYVCARANASSDISWCADGRLPEILGLPSIRLKEPCKNRALFQRRPSIYVLMLCCLIHVFNMNTQRERTSCSPASKQLVCMNIHTRYVCARTDAFPIYRGVQMAGSLKHYIMASIYVLILCFIIYVFYINSKGLAASLLGHS